MRSKSVAEHRAAGTYRQDRHGQRCEEVAATGQPRKPEWVSADPVANDCWETIVSGSHPGVLARVDSLTIGAAARWFAVWRRLDHQLAEGGGDDYKLTVQASAAFKQFLACVTKLGMTPVDRAKLHLAPHKDGPPALATRNRSLSVRGA